MSRRKNNQITSDSLDSKLLYFTIIAIVISNFIVRLKLFTNVRSFDMSMMQSASNFFTYYKLVWTLAITIILMAFLIYKIYKYKQKLELNFLMLGSGLIIIASLISFALDPIGQVSVWGLFSRNNGLLAYLSLFLLIYIIACFEVQTKHIIFMIHTLNIASIIFVIIGIFQFFGLDMTNSLWFKQLYIPSEYKYLIQSINVSSIPFLGTKYYWASSIFGQVNYFGAFCSIILPFITVFALNEVNIIKKALLMLGSVMLFIGTVLAQSLGSIATVLIILLLIAISFVNKHNYKSFILMSIGYIITSEVINRLTNWLAFSEIYNLLIKAANSKLLSFGICMAVIYILLFTFRRKISKYRYLLISIAIITVILIGAIGYIYVLNNVVESHMDLMSNRGYIWYYSNELIKQNFIFGYGPDNLYYNFPQMNENHKTYMIEALVDKPHNMFLQVMLDTGIFGLIGFIILLVGMLLKSNKAIDLESDIHKNAYLKALMLAILAYMIQGMVNDNIIAIQAVIYLLMGIGASLVSKVKLFSKI